MREAETGHNAKKIERPSGVRARKMTAVRVLFKGILVIRNTTRERWDSFDANLAKCNDGRKMTRIARRTKGKNASIWWGVMWCRKTWGDAMCTSNVSESESGVLCPLGEEKGGKWKKGIKSSEL